MNSSKGIGLIFYIIFISLLLVTFGFFFLKSENTKSEIKEKSNNTVKEVTSKVKDSLVSDRMKMGRDSSREFDLNSMENTIKMTQVGAPMNSNILCNGPDICVGSTLDTNASFTDGGGWVKIDFTEGPFSFSDGLVLDPINDDEYHYIYCSKDGNWEINAKFESEFKSEKMVSDGGDDANLYEFGTDLFLISVIPECIN